MKSIYILSSIALVFSSCKPQESASTEAAAPEAVASTYPLDVCVVSGEELGSMGDPVVIQHEGQEVRFCCDSCLPKFKKDPAKYLSKLEK
ncbi:hypothetical protein ACFQY0_10015 [Haloferula chungangensis]|uniref:TRASH domain-containing protein n=1 Tax=Haloferula chungangensis TaxID=1048331 RepID=A0ABW2L7K0_9BACT